MTTAAAAHPLTDIRTLDLGAGTAVRHPGALRLDRARVTCPHVVADLDGPGLPFRASVFDRVAAYDVVEHVADLPHLMEEVYRVLKPGGLLMVTTPHFSCDNAYADPTHRRALSLRSFDYFTGSHELAYYAQVRFRIRHRQLFFRAGMVNRVMAWVARSFPQVYEQRLSWVFPAWFMYFELEAQK